MRFAPDPRVPATADRSAAIQEGVEQGLLRPVLDVNGCAFCRIPRGDRTRSILCHTCQQIRQFYGQALEFLDIVAFSTDRDALEGTVRTWKDSWGACADGPLAQFAVPPILPIVAALSAYMEARHDELGLGETDILVAAVPSSTPVILNATLAAHRGWYAPELTVVAEADPTAPSQRSLDRDGRLRSGEGKWRITTDVTGRYVLLLDDVFTTGASMSSLARQLVRAGASGVAGLVVVRHILGHVYEDALHVYGGSWDPLVRNIGAWPS